MSIVSADSLASHYDAVVIGSGFGSLFYLHGLRQRRPDWRVLVLERGRINSHEWQLENMRNSPVAAADTFATPDAKVWNFTIGYGGGTNCWFAQTPRLLPSDFRTRTLYGVGQDWPMSYDDLERFYCEAEDIMAIAGPADMGTVSPRSKPYPLPPHNLTTPDRAMKEAQPELHYSIPTARASIPTATRTQCCDSARCNLCPVDAKFTALNGFEALQKDEKTDICLEAEVRSLEHEGGAVRKAVFRAGGRERKVSADLFVLGANAIHSPAILLRSGIDHPLTGVGLNEQIGLDYEVMLDGMDNFDGSTITTGINLSAYEGDFRRDHASTLIYFENRWKYGFRKEWNRWRQTLPLTIVVEDQPMEENFVAVDGKGDVIVRHQRHSEYGLRGADAIRERLPDILSPLPVEKIVFHGWRQTESHVQGSLRMGLAREDSVVDGSLLHHDIRNLAVVGTALFPTCPPMNPSLTAAALSLRAAHLHFA